MLVFLQNWRSTLIPLTAVPVAIIGTFAVMAAIGFSLNNLTLFGLVLAIGIVVDDAIVVVEAVEHHIEEGLAPQQAAIKAMEQVSGPVMAVALVLSAVFMPCAFISGITGQFFRQFALTIAVSTIISAFNSLTLSPALAALFLQSRSARKDWFGRLLDLVFGWFFRLFNRGFGATTSVYTRMVGLGCARQRRGAGALRRLGGLDVVDFDPPADGLHPRRMDKSKSVRSHSVARLRLAGADAGGRGSDLPRSCTTPAASLHTLSVAGQSFTLGANGSNFGKLFITLDGFDQRHDPELYSDEIAAVLRKEIATARFPKRS